MILFCIIIIFLIVSCNGDSDDNDKIDVHEEYSAYPKKVQVSL